VIGLVHGNRHGEGENDDPGDHDPTAATAEEPCKLDHELTHWLDSQPFEQTTRAL